MTLRALRLLAILSATATIASASAAQDATVPPVATAPAAAPVPEKLVCQRIVPTGSHLGTRVCKTSAQWKAESAENSRDLDSLRRGSPGQR